MKKTVCVVLAAVVMLTSAACLAFSDIALDDELLEAAAAELSKLEIINGYEDGTFRAEKSITRAEMAQILRNLLPNKKDNTPSLYDTAFNDLKSSHWAYEAIAVMNSMGIVMGNNAGKVRPDDKVTNAEAVTMIIRMLGYEGEAIENGGYPLGYLNTAIETTLLNGLSLELNSPATRGDVAVMIYNMLDIPVMTVSGYNIKTDKTEYEVSVGNTFRKIIEEY